ncbi:hypothetical protein HER15_08095 [Tenacibaculum mesophilum]|uniref:Uncharacterized protein n=1 Tax=Tenacibaculum mesophilum TaxID=104268 RepID=A0AAE9MLB6_9FLAO|nr:MULTISPECIES: hypothetical protein [Tenacibaculum]MCO7183892.1 hypothetical protein [Tenacibaculum sp. XPcli2-G]UTD15427.1 hypothetical protein HER15_08095 [Tenacibaculum mesophilum]
MNDLGFYKSIYDRELNRRKSLDDSISIPTGIISLLIGLLSFYYTSEEYKIIVESNKTALILLGIIFVLLTLSIVFLVKSYNNFLRGFCYPNISLLEKVRHFQKVAIPDYNEQVSKEKQIDFEEELTNKLIAIADRNTQINDVRALYLYRAKTFIILSLAVIFITTIFLIIKKTELC